MTARILQMASILSIGLPLAVMAAPREVTTKTSATGTAQEATEAKPMLFRASTLEKLKVRNLSGDDLGKISDMVIDANTGKITYVALDFGGFLGVGDKLFAVPWHSFRYEMANNEEHLVLDVPKERLKQAPGFDKSHWPNMADPQWSHDVDKFYGPPRTARRAAP